MLKRLFEWLIPIRDFGTFAYLDDKGRLQSTPSRAYADMMNSRPFSIVGSDGTPCYRGWGEAVTTYYPLQSPPYYPEDPEEVLP